MIWNNRELNKFCRIFSPMIPERTMVLAKVRSDSPGLYIPPSLDFTRLPKIIVRSQAGRFLAIIFFTKSFDLLP